MDSLLQRMQQGGLSRDNAIATAKDRGLIKQDGDSLALTDKGRDAARKAKQSLSDQQQNKGGIKTKYNA